MSIMEILGLALLAVFVEVAFVPAKAERDDVIKVAVIDTSPAHSRTAVSGLQICTRNTVPLAPDFWRVGSCPCRKLNPDVLVVQSTQNWHRQYVTECICFAFTPITTIASERTCP
jgi:hypothetical protein